MGVAIQNCGPTFKGKKILFAMEMEMYLSLFETVVLDTPARSWRNENLRNCFIDCLKRLLMGLEGFAISDLFFPEVCWFLVLPLVLYILFALKVNLVNRIKKDEVIKNITINLQRKLEAFEDTADILRIYPI